MLPEPVCKLCLAWMLDDLNNPGWLKCLCCGFMKKGSKSMVSRKEILMNRDEEYPLTPEMEDNLSKLLEAVNKLRTLYGKPMYVSSGYRPGKYNEAAGGAKKSAHLVCKAVDFKDVNEELETWITDEILEQCGLWREDPEKTKGWVHVDIVPRKNRTFKI